MKRAFRAILIIAYAWVSYSTNIQYTAETITEIIIGLMISTLFMNILETAGYHLAFEFIGNNRWLFGNSVEMSIGHWVIRLAWATVIFLLAFTPLFALFLNPLIHFTSVLIDTYFANMMEQMCQNLIRNKSHI